MDFWSELLYTAIILGVEHDYKHLKQILLHLKQILLRRKSNVDFFSVQIHTHILGIHILAITQFKIFPLLLLTELSDEHHKTN